MSISRRTHEREQRDWKRKESTSSLPEQVFFTTTRSKQKTTTKRIRTRILEIERMDQRK